MGINERNCRQLIGPMRSRNLLWTSQTLSPTTRLTPSWLFLPLGLGPGWHQGPVIGLELQPLALALEHRDRHFEVVGQHAFQRDRRPGMWEKCPL